jgi:polar amino acid transport system substrate-binding protein
LRVRKALTLLVLATGLLLAAGCGGDDNESAGGTTEPTASCDKASLDLVNSGQLTIGTDNPAFPPWFEGTKEFDPWDPTTEPTKKGYEQEVAYGIANELGFTDDEVKWTVVPFNQSFRPGPKKFDFDINQISFKPVRAKAVDFSDSYYDVNQALVVVNGTPVAKAKSIAALKPYKFGAQLGTTSYDFINDTIMPSKQPAVFDTNDAAVQALKNKQIDGLVVDLPTAFFVSAAQVENSKILGQFPSLAGEHFGMVFAKGNSLVSCVNEALAELKADGTLQDIQDQWLSKAAGAPVLK